MTNSPSVLYGIREQFPMESEESVRKSVHMKKHHQQPKRSIINIVTTGEIVEIELMRKSDYCNP